MRHGIIALMLIGVLSACASNGDLRCALPGEHTKASIVRVIANNKDFSSGVVVSKNRVITVAHALEKANAVSIQYKGQHREASILSLDKHTDLALLATDTGNLRAIDLSENELKPQEPVWSVAFPMAMSQRTELGLFHRTFNNRLLTSTHANQGSSGGGLLRCHQGSFELAGVIHGYVAIQVGHDRFNSGDSTSVPASRIRYFLNASASKERQLLSGR